LLAKFVVPERRERAVLGVICPEHSGQRICG
jgi:hypothetical protein